MKIDKYDLLIDVYLCNSYVEFIGLNSRKNISYHTVRVTPLSLNFSMRSLTFRSTILFRLTVIDFRLPKSMLYNESSVFSVRRFWLRFRLDILVLATLSMSSGRISSVSLFLMSLTDLIF